MPGNEMTGFDLTLEAELYVVFYTSALLAALD